jgi:cysteinyl-tRNA synthetase
MCRPDYDSRVTLRLRNTLTRSVEPVERADGMTVRMYSCGPTVYRFAHVGNLRTFLLADLIRRAVLYHGVAVFQVQNITDVGHLRDERFDRGEDRMLVAAGLENKTTQEIADAYEAAFHADAALLNLLPAHVFPRATEHIPEMLDLAQQLVDRGHAYVSAEGNVYYDVASFPEYGRLSGNTLDALRAGHRGEVEGDKRDSADFALWKAAGEGRLLKWPTERWGEGYPGWHLECSAMALKHLGPRFDVHTGGIDNVFPHHEDEIAQSAPVVGGPPARLWVHGEFLQVGGQKMAKSAGNIERIADVADRGVDPLAFRYLALTSRYRHKLEYTPDSLAAAAAGLESLRERLRALGPPPADGPWQAPEPLVARAAPARPIGTRGGTTGHGGTPDLDLVDRAHAPAAPLSNEGRARHERFVAALDDDLDLPTALAVVREALRAPMPEDERRWLALDADFVLGLDLHEAWTASDAGDDWTMPADILAILDERTAARASRDFARADALRATLAERGWDVVDGPDGSVARPVAGSRT